jgi:hypothetical protein
MLCLRLNLSKLFIILKLFSFFEHHRDASDLSEAKSGVVTEDDGWFMLV